MGSRPRFGMLLAVAAASLLGVGGASAGTSATLPCKVTFSRPAANKLVVKISKCTAPDVIDVRFQFKGKTTITKATPFKVKFTTCKIVQKSTWDCHFGGGLPSGPTARPVTATLNLAGLHVGITPNYVIVYATYSDGTKVKVLYKLPIAH